KGNSLHPWMVQHGPTGLRTETMNDVEYSRWKSGFPTAPCEQVCRHWRELRRLGDDSIAGCQGGRDLPGQKIERQVPGGDAGHNTQGRAQSVIQGGIVSRVALARKLCDCFCNEFEVQSPTGY